MNSYISAFLNRFKSVQYYKKGKAVLTDPGYIDGQEKDRRELLKTPSRTDVINSILSRFQRDTNYLEIGVRFPEDNYNHIQATVKYSVDPGMENAENPVDFKVTSDEFFKQLRNGELLTPDTRFDVIFIDGLHLADQVDRDIENALSFLKEDGFIVMHDCNPPTEWHARSAHGYNHTPAHVNWNGTTWKAFLKWRFNPQLNSCCVDTDWGVGVLSGVHPIGKSIEQQNPFFEFSQLEEQRKNQLNLVSFEQFEQLLSSIHIQ